MPTSQQDELFRLVVRNFVNTAPNHWQVLVDSYLSPVLIDIDKWIEGKDLPAEMSKRIHIINFIWNHWSNCKCN